MFKRSIVWGAIFALTTSTALAQNSRNPGGFGQIVCGHRLGGHVHAPVRTDDLGCQPRRADGQSRALPQRRPAHAARRYAATGELVFPAGADRRQPLLPRHEESQHLRAGHQEAGEIILIDGNFEYATEAEIHEGLRFLGLDPKKVKYSIYAHAHGDHDGGAHLTQAAIPGVTIVYGDRRLAERAGPHRPACDPQRTGE